MNEDLKQRIRSRILRVHGYNIVLRPVEKVELFEQVYVLIIEALSKMPRGAMTHHNVNVLINNKLRNLIGE